MASASIKQCKNCGITFNSQNGAYCGKSCYKKHIAAAKIANAEHYMTGGKCQNCSKPCIVDRKFCSKRCVMAARVVPDQCKPSPTYKAGECLQCKADINMPVAEGPNNRVIPKYCNRTCYDIYRAESRKCVCDHCGEAFAISPGRRKAKKKFCSMKCRKLGLKPPPIHCKNCGVWFTAIKQVKAEARFHADKNRLHCSERCVSESLSSNQERKDKISRAFTGKKHPNWQGGSGSVHRGYRGPGWVKQAEKARKRDSYQCQDCGMTQADHGRKLEVHHKIPFRQNSSESANKLSNLITLCKSCHTAADHKYRRENLVQMVLI